MSKRSSTIPRSFKFRLVPLASVAAGLICLATWLSPVPRHDAVLHAPEALDAGRGVSGDAQQSPPPKLEGVGARAYLEKTGGGQSLMKALTAERFGLKPHKRAPFKGEADGGYLGMSHDQNLNAWFDEDGITVRPTLSEEGREKGWQLGFRLRSYGYGRQLTDAAPIVSHLVKDNRIEYERGGIETGARVVEWYENKAAGIEQGFTFSERPAAVSGSGVSAGEPLRLVLAVTGDLRARVKDGGQSVELSNEGGEGVLSYSKLVAIDAGGKKLAARMEVNDEGDEIALVVDDREAVYPLVIDPITATLEKTLEAGGNRQSDSRFGFAVALDGDIAVVGAWREDVPFTSLVDAGAVYIFSRSGSTWDSATRIHLGDAANAVCGWSVAISSNRVVYGCRGANNLTGRAYLLDLISGIPTEIIPSPGNLEAGDQFGYSVAISGTDIVVGAPLWEPDSSIPNVGLALTFVVNSDGSVSTERANLTGSTNSQLGTSVAIEGDTVVAGGLGQGGLSTLDPVTRFPDGQRLLLPFDGKGENFGESIAVHGDTLVVGAWGDDDKGTDAGAAYVFARTNGSWSHQQKLTAGDGRAGDHFGEHAVAVEGHMIVVGATGWDLEVSGDNAGAAYVFTRSGTVWSAQTQLNGAAGENFGIDVDISDNSLIVGARAAHAGGTALSGAAYVYRLNCVPPSNYVVIPMPTACPGSVVTLGPASTSYSFGTLSYQWRKNGVNIPGATGANYTINNVTTSDAGSYDLIVSSACGSDISTPATLNVHTNSINPTSQNFGAAGSSGIVNVSSTGSCAWTAASNASWLTVTSGSSGAGSGTVGFNVAANTGAAQRTGTLTIAGRTFTVTQDGTTPPSNTFQFSQSAYSTSEGSGSTTITVIRSGSLSAPATVEYATTDGTATDRGDYNTTIGRLRFAAGEGSKSFAVLVTDDAYAEGTESLNLTLSNPTGGPALGPPSIASLSITDNDAVTSGSNPIDATPFFVRQQYVDFFSREPDAGGLAFWSGGIDSCGANAGCRDGKRVDTSAAFFLSIEFQETGFLAHRLYRASFNRLARYREFVRDTQEIGRGVVVNSPGWEAQLAANKAAFLNEFAARADFQALYGGMTNAQYVDAINANTAGSLSQGERDSLVSGLNGGTETRATALRKAADDPDFRARETRPAFVLMQYYGYLRRNPDDAPDSDFAGYNFWLGKLNEFGGDYRRAEMVRAFILSTEYRRRFGL